MATTTTESHYRMAPGREIDTRTYMAMRLRASPAAGGLPAAPQGFHLARLPVLHPTCVNNGKACGPRVPCRPAWAMTRMLSFAAGKRGAYREASPARMPIPAFVAASAAAVAAHAPLPADATICGRITSPLRRTSASTVFFHIESEGGRVQVMADKRDLADPEVVDALNRGDVVQASGKGMTTRTGEISLRPKDLSVLSPCVRMADYGRGDGKYRLADSGFLHRHREVELLLGGAPSREVFIKRFKAVHALRCLMIESGFTEVETPILQAQAGGAFAKAFKTTERGLSLRIAPELSLKRLVVGGFDRVFELGKVFRDEGLSPRHNPEFTSCEAYQAYASVDDMVQLTRRALCAMGNAMECDTKVFEAPFAVVSVAEELARAGVLVDDAESLTLPRLVRACEQAGLPPSPVQSVPRLLDQLVGAKAESLCRPEVPTLLTEHPTALSPLARELRPGVAQRFELFYQAVELCNAYGELADPEEQRRRFQQQAAITGKGDDEAQLLDEDFCEALEYGMPPTVGWGMGVDRTVLILLGLRSIKDVMLFPLSR